MKRDWSKSKAELRREVARTAEAYLAGQIQFATSADQRASVMASVFTAAGAGLIAAVLAYGAQPGAAQSAIMAGGGVAAALFLVAASLCVWAVLPVGFDLPGTQPESWDDDIATGKNVEDSLCELCDFYQEKIADNREILRRNARKFKWGAITGIAAPLIGLAVWVAVSFWSSVFC